MRDVDSSSCWKLLQSEQALARKNDLWYAVHVGSSPTPIITEVISFSFEFHGDLDKIRVSVWLSLSVMPIGNNFNMCNEKREC